MKFLDVTEKDTKEGICSKCGRHKYVVRIVHVKNGKIEWRCNRCVRKLGRDIAHKLAQKELEEREKFYGA